MEVAEVVHFLANTLPFNYLDKDNLVRIARQINIVYFQAQESVDTRPPRLFILRSGVFLLRNRQQQLLGKLQEGDLFGYERLLARDTEPCQLICEEDGLLFWLDAENFQHLIATQPRVAGFFNALARHTLHQFREAPSSFHLTLRIDQVIGPRKVVIPPDRSILEAAQLMTANRVSTVLIEDGEKLLGLVTDRDLRSRVLAQGTPVTAPISSVMTRSLVTIGRDDYLFEAIQAMGMHNIHHLPVVDNGKTYGMLSITDVIRVQQDHPVYLINNIHRQNNLAGLKACGEKIKPLLLLLGKQHLPAHEIGQVMTTITDALTKRLIALAQEELGTAPCHFCWIAFGSQARMDQSINSDQDNALILAHPVAGAEADYFARLTDFVCRGLHECGIRFCPGNIMAANSELRLSLADWCKKIDFILHSPTPDSVLKSSIFFDVRAIDGHRDLCDQLQDHLLRSAPKNRLFLYHLAQAALQQRAPLGLFKGFILTHEGEQQPGCDLKKTGISLITDIARVYAMDHGIKAVNTRQRLLALAKNQAMDSDSAQNLLDAFDLIAQLRWEKHQWDLQNHQSVSNLVDPARLPSLQRHQLRDSFAVINEGQAVMKFRYCRGL